MSQTPEQAIGYYVTTNGVGVVTVRNPPVNAISRAVRLGLLLRIGQAEKDTRVSSVLLVGHGRTFPAGADISEFSGTRSSDDIELWKLCDRIEASTKPVVCAIHGTALGGGLEIALGTHYRIGSSNARFGLPEVTLGIVPGAGGTQRLPRVVGIEKAIGMVTGGVPINAKKALSFGLITEIVNVDPKLAASPNEEEAMLHAGLRLAAEVQGKPFDHLRVSRFTAKAVPESVYQKAKAKLGKNRQRRGEKAPYACLEAVWASTKPYAEGIAAEQSIQAELAKSGQGAALQHLFFSQRAASKIRGVNMKDLMPVNTVGVIGSGVMGGGICMNLIQAGIPTVLIDAKKEFLERGLKTIRTNYAVSVKRGRFTQQQVDTFLARITPSLDYADLKDVDVVIEAVFELMDLKKQIFRRLDDVTKKSAILATNTSALDVDEIASVTRRPEKVIGMHFFSPANIMQLVENVRGAKSSDSTIATIMALTKRIKKVGVLVGNCPGFVGNRMRAAYGSELAYMIEDGAYPDKVDDVLFGEYGMAMGPFAVADLVGLDLGWRGRKQAGLLDPNSPARKALKTRYAHTIPDKLAEMERFGMKNGKGWFDYSENPRQGKVDPVVTKIIEDTSRELGITRRPHSAQEIIDRSLCCMVNVGFHILEEGYADKPSDIDVIYMFGYGYPKHRGGPMFWADQIGLDKVYQVVKRYGDLHPELEYWRMSPLLEHCAKTGVTLGKYWATVNHKQAAQQKSSL